MRLGNIFFYLLVFIVGPIIRGLLESERKKKGWEKRPVRPRRPGLPINLEEHPWVGEKLEKPKEVKTEENELRVNLPLEKTDLAKPRLYRKRLEVASSQTEKKTADKVIARVERLEVVEAQEPCYMEDKGLGTLEAEDILKGIIISEILGPPKASIRHR